MSSYIIYRIYFLNEFLFINENLFPYRIRNMKFLLT